MKRNLTNSIVTQYIPERVVETPNPTNYGAYILRLYPDEPTVTNTTGHVIGQAISDSNGFLARRMQIAASQTQPLTTSELSQPTTVINRIADSISTDEALSVVNATDTLQIASFVERLRNDLRSRVGSQELQEATERLSTSVLQHRERQLSQWREGIDIDVSTLLNFVRYPELREDRNILNNFFELFSYDIIHDLLSSLNSTLSSVPTRILLLSFFLAVSNSLLNLTYLRIFSVVNTNRIVNFIRDILERILQRRIDNQAQAQLRHLADQANQRITNFFRRLIGNVRNQSLSVYKEIINLFLRIYWRIFRLFLTESNFRSSSRESNGPDNSSNNSLRNDN